MRRVAGDIVKKDAISRLRSLYKNDRMAYEQRLASEGGLSFKELDQVKDVFRHFDVDRNKHLCRRECHNLFKHQTGQVLEKPAFDKVFNKMDTDSDGLISFPEYLRHISNRKKKLPSSHELQEIFDTFDRNEDGRMSLDDFRSSLLYMGEDAGRPDLKQIFVRHDADKDGLISRYEFQDMVFDDFKR